jgi:prophage regulatory protein
VSIYNQHGALRTMRTQVIRLSEVCTTTALARSTIYKLISEGTFPEPIKLTARSSGWLVSEVEEWITNRLVASRTTWEVE